MSTFFAFNGQYEVAETTGATDLLNDVGCWTSSARAIIEQLAIELDEEGSGLSANPKTAVQLLWAAFHLLQMAGGGVDATFGRLADKEAPA